MASRSASSWAWEHFYKDGSKHGKNGGSGQNAWCVGCLNNVIQQRRSQATARDNEGKTYEQLRGEVISEQVVKSRKGKPQDSLIPHLCNCKFVPLSVRIRAGSNEKTNGEGNENETPGKNGSGPCPDSRSKQYVAVTPGPYNYRPIQHMQGHNRTRSSSLPPMSMSATVPPLQQWDNGTTSTITNSVWRSSKDLNEDERAIKRVKVERWSQQLRKEFNCDFTSMILGSGVSWNFADNPHVHWLLQKWIPGVEVPCRRTVSGPVLNMLADNVVQDMKLRLSGKKAMAQSDGWKNTAKTCVVASLVTVDQKPYILKTHDISARPKTGEELLDIVKGDISYAQEVLRLEIIGWCTDDGGDARKMRRLLQEEYKHLIVTFCWAHQINLAVGDIISLKLPIFECIPSALEVVKWFNSHSRALGILNTEQKTIPGQDGKALALILPVITRWTAHYCSLRRLSEVEGAIRSSWSKYSSILLGCAGQTRSAKEKAEEIQKIVQDQVFWDRVNQTKTLLEPFAIAANITQAPNTSLCHVILTLGNLFRIFSVAPIDNPVREGILGILEKCWAKADQDLFIAAAIMNPYIRDSCFTSSIPELTRKGLFAIVKRVCERVLNQRTDSEFCAAFVDYLNKEAEFGPDFMTLDEMKEEARKKNEEPNLIHIWEGIKTSAVGGRNDLVLFAIHILSVVPNSASSERLFSNMGITHTKLRNLLGLDKVTKSCMVRMDIRRRYQAAGIGPKPRKRKLAEVLDESPGGNVIEDGKQMSNYEDATPFTLDSVTQSYEAMTEALMEDIRLSDEADVDTNIGLTLPPTPSLTPQMSYTMAASMPAVPYPIPAAVPSVPTTFTGSSIPVIAAPPSTAPSSTAPSSTAPSSTAPPSTAPYTAAPTQRKPKKTSIPLSVLFRYPSPEKAWDGVDDYWKGGIHALTEVELRQHELVTGIAMGGELEDGSKD